MAKKSKKFISKFITSKHLIKGGRKEDSNYYRRKIIDKKIAYISDLINNTDLLVIVASVDLPKFKPGLIDRFLILSQIENVEPLIIITKIDLLAQGQKKEEYGKMYEDAGFKTLYVSNTTKQGLKEIAGLLKDKISAIVGHSGVGKTTLLNNIEPNFCEKVQEISNYTKRGRHTTSKISLFDLSFGGKVYDMPGLKEIGFISLSRRELSSCYPDIDKYSGDCKFSDCNHIHEKDCGVKKALEKGLIHPVRYENYQNIFESLPER